jgi:undecaprenyl pyrophosphate phosphatase UppP
MNAEIIATTKKHRPTWMRVLDILCRTLHIAVAGLLLSGFVYQVPFSQLHLWHSLTILTGLGLVMLEVAHSRNWPHQIRGVMCMIHIGLPSLAHILPALVIPLSAASLAFGSIGSHLPKKLRHWSILYRKEVD